MPFEKLIGHTVRTGRIATDGIEGSTVQAVIIMLKHCDFVVILLQVSVKFVNKKTDILRWLVSKKKA
jgi:hypothetical protein